MIITVVREGNSLMTTASNIFRGCQALQGYESLFFAAHLGQMAPTWLLPVQLVQGNSKNDFGGGISWILIKFQAEISQRIWWWDFSPEKKFGAFDFVFVAFFNASKTVLR